MGKRYWLRGGMYGLAISVVLFLITVSVSDQGLQFLILLALPIVAVFLIVLGLVIGWLYGKIKNRNKI